MTTEEKVVRRLKTQAAIAEVASVRLRQAGDYDNADDWIRTSRELYNIINLLTAPIDQQGEPVGWVSSYQLEQVASDPRILGVVTTLYKHRPEGTTFHVPLYLHPPASREADDGTE